MYEKPTSYDQFLIDFEDVDSKELLEALAPQLVELLKKQWTLPRYNKGTRVTFSDQNCF